MSVGMYNILDSINADHHKTNSVYRHYRHMCSSLKKKQFIKVATVRESSEKRKNKSGNFHFQSGKLVKNKKKVKEKGISKVSEVASFQASGSFL